MGCHSSKPPSSVANTLPDVIPNSTLLSSLGVAAPSKDVKAGIEIVARERNVKRLVHEAAKTIVFANDGTLSTFSHDGAINSRIVGFRPLDLGGSSEDLHFLLISTNKYSRKYQEVIDNPKATIVFFDKDDDGEVALKGNIAVLNPFEAAELWIDRWYDAYPDGPNTPDYAVLRMDNYQLEFVSRRFHIDEGAERKDWRPLTLRRCFDGAWKYVPPPPSNLMHSL
eukprot:TRINITY_DN29744_c0_g1_i1.p1 TRINITY_DN29744_c0_g1~~TRINITY_DN29744_c0_g1_i1.p1  ORF type:complete len:225 (-),score=30.10 TRINITY_DN29744_c0_g1_i1:135-809(-)